MTQGYTPANQYRPPAKDGITLNKGKNLADNGVSLLLKDLLGRDRPEVWDAGAYQHSP